ncbi:MAG TPA: 4a-hydroxytetrahydrobiopterin dehydratase [Actinomycetota bacterium]|nr:4a-hydroxytetrahydrobiopterin dehydratase [Actinomycetota bacterium]
MPAAEPLSDEEVARALEGLPGWRREGNELYKWFRFDGFPQAVAFLQRLVEPAERMNHHPDVENHQARVRIGLHTWSVGSITARDVALAREVERAAAGG